MQTARNEAIRVSRATTFAKEEKVVGTAGEAYENPVTGEGAVMDREPLTDRQSPSTERGRRVGRVPRRRLRRVS
jgi:hypothetical protein